MDLAGFIDAPVYGPAKYASSPTVAPIAIAAYGLSASIVELKTRITSIKNAVNPNSIHALSVIPATGSVAPNVSLSGNTIFKTMEARNAPSN